MYEQFKNDLLMTLNNESDLSSTQIKSVISCLDLAMYNYEIHKKETAIVLYNQEIPYLVKTFIACKSIEGFSKGTLYNYTRFLKNFFFAVQKAPEQITTNDVRIYLYNYQKEREVSNRSLDKIRNCFSSFYYWMYSEGYIEKNPMLSIGKIKYNKKSKIPCSQADLEYLRMACKTLKQKAILEVLYSTGCRVGELVVLKKSDIDWHDKTVLLFGKGQKYRTSFLNAKAEVALKEYLNSRKDNEEWLFVSDRHPHGQMHVCGVQKIMRGIVERTGDNINKNVTCHILRHTTASRMLENGADLSSIQTILGHDNINTTMIYAHNTLEHVKNEHRKAIV